ncbi:MAG TPA: A24 family peptidase [Caulobacteraceae bacterium]
MALLIALFAALPASAAAVFAARRFGTALDRRQAAAVVAATVSLFAWAALASPGDWRLTASCALAWSLLVLAAVDLTQLRLPDLLTLPLLAAGLFASLFLPEAQPLDHLAGAAAAYGAMAGLAWAYSQFRGREGLGLGDAKLLAAAGAWLGWQALPSVVLVACAAAFAMIGLRWTMHGRETLRQPFPFGAPLCLAFWLTWLHGPLGPA